MTTVIKAKVMHKSIPSLLCKMCGHADEIITHLLTAYPVPFLTTYIDLPNLIATIVHWYLLWVHSVPVPPMYVSSIMHTVTYTYIYCFHEMTSTYIQFYRINKLYIMYLLHL